MWSVKGHPPASYTDLYPCLIFKTSLRLSLTEVPATINSGDVVGLGDGSGLLFCFSYCQLWTRLSQIWKVNSNGLPGFVFSLLNFITCFCGLLSLFITIYVFKKSFSYCFSGVSRESKRNTFVQSAMFSLIFTLLCAHDNMISLMAGILSALFTTPSCVPSTWRILMYGIYSQSESFLVNRPTNVLDETSE